MKRAFGPLALAWIATVAPACKTEPDTRPDASVGDHGAAVAPAADHDAHERSSAPSGAPAAAAAATPSLAFVAQPGWVSETPATSSRKAQYRLPHASGDSEDAALVVYYFGGQGGSVQANLERWAAQFEQPDG